jgi:uncharacterized protein YjbI with pentapeptide repeats
MEAKEGRIYDTLSPRRNLKAIIPCQTYYFSRFEEIMMLNNEHKPYFTAFSRLKRLFLNSHLLDRFLVILLGFMLPFMLFITPAAAISYNNRALNDHDFSGQDLRDASFDHSNLRGSDLSYANLSGVRFFASNLSIVNFEGANLTNADLESCRLTGSNFTNAILEGAFVVNTLFRGATIDGADFTDALLRSDTQKMLCEIAQGTNPTTGRNTRETLLCD